MFLKMLCANVTKGHILKCGVLYLTQQLPCQLVEDRYEMQAYIYMTLLFDIFVSKILCRIHIC